MCSGHHDGKCWWAGGQGADGVIVTGRVQRVQIKRRAPDKCWAGGLWGIVVYEGRLVPLIICYYIFELHLEMPHKASTTPYHDIPNFDCFCHIIQGPKSRITITPKCQAYQGETHRHVFSEVHSFSPSPTFD